MSFSKMPHPHDGVRVRLGRERHCLKEPNYALRIRIVKPIIICHGPMTIPSWRTSGCLFGWG
jgi:hypothetical protein